jgi:hypothetical protein
MKIVNDRILAVANAFDELHALVTSEPALVEFTPATTELQAIAQRVRAGLSVELTVSPNATARIPYRVLAERILAIVNRAPGPMGTEDVETRHIQGPARQPCPSRRARNSLWIFPT